MGEKGVEMGNLTGENVKETEKKAMPVSPGRPKGVQNKLTKEVKTMILEALHKAGGVKYLTEQAKVNPKAFLTLLGKVMPMQVTGENGGPLQVFFTQQDADL